MHQNRPMDSGQEYTEIFANKFSQMGISFMLDDEEPMSAEFEQYAGNLMSCWVMTALMHEEPEAFMMMLNQISKMRRIDLVGTVAFAIAGQAYNPFGNRIPPELDAIMGVVHAEPSLDLIVESFNEIGHAQIAFLEEMTVKFKPA